MAYTKSDNSHFFGLTPEQARAVYEEIELNYLIEDAEYQYLEYIFTRLPRLSDCQEDMSEYYLENMKTKYGKDIFKRLALEFQKRKDCDCADNATWEYIIINFFDTHQ